jgi:hypothetical protein
MCRKAAVSSRQSSPSSTRIGIWASWANSGENWLSRGLAPARPAETAVATNMATLSPMRLTVTSPKRLLARRSRGTWRGRRTPACPSRTQWGHWNPTEAGVMHSGQIGRPHRAQEMRVGRSGCR